MSIRYIPGPQKVDTVQQKCVDRVFAKVAKMREYSGLLGFQQRLKVLFSQQLKK
jgi:hypothetical protein